MELVKYNPLRNDKKIYYIYLQRKLKRKQRDNKRETKKITPFFSILRK